VRLFHSSGALRIQKAGEMKKPKQYTAKMVRTLVTKIEGRQQTRMTLAEWFAACQKQEDSWADFLREEKAKEKLDDMRYEDPGALAYVETHLSVSVSRVVQGLKRLGIMRSDSWVRQTRRLVFDARGAVSGVQS
jgi:hypothetical protein